MPRGAAGAHQYPTGGERSAQVPPAPSQYSPHSPSPVQVSGSTVELVVMFIGQSTPGQSKSRITNVVAGSFGGQPEIPFMVPLVDGIHCVSRGIHCVLSVLL